MTAGSVETQTYRPWTTYMSAREEARRRAIGLPARITCCSVCWRSRLLRGQWASACREPRPT